MIKVIVIIFESDGRPFCPRDGSAKRRESLKNVKTKTKLVMIIHLVTSFMDDPSKEMVNNEFKSNYNEKCEQLAFTEILQCHY